MFINRSELLAAGSGENRAGLVCAESGVRKTMGRAVVLAVAAIVPLAGCGALLPMPCVSAGPRSSVAYQACMQADYARAMQEMDYKAWLDLTKGQMGQ